MTSTATMPTEAPTFPIVYLMELSLDGSSVEGYAEGDLLLINTIEQPRAGDLVCVHPRNGCAVMMVLEMDLGHNAWERMPYREAPGSEVRALLIGKVLGTDRTVAMNAKTCLPSINVTARPDHHQLSTPQHITSACPRLHQPWVFSFFWGGGWL